MKCCRGEIRQNQCPECPPWRTITLGILRLAFQANPWIVESDNVHCRHLAGPSTGHTPRASRQDVVTSSARESSCHRYRAQNLRARPCTRILHCHRSANHAHACQPEIYGSDRGSLDSA